MRFRERRRLMPGIGLAGVAVAAVIFAAVLRAQAVPVPAVPVQGVPVQINGAGATFPYPIYSAWFARYAETHPGVQINYLSVGSGAGIRQFSEQIVFFGATDTPMTEDEYQAALGRALHLPTVVGAVAPIYNLPGLRAPLKIDGSVLADIFLGKIRNWNDAAIVRLNPDLPLPATDITVVYRADSSGTTYIWGDYLSKRSPDWRRLIGPNRVMNAPIGVTVGTGVRGSEAVSAMVRQTPGAIGYIELSYALRDHIDMALVQNAANEFVRPSVEGARAAAQAAVPQMPQDFRVSITNAPGTGVYPISSFTWMLLYQNSRDKARSRLMVEFMKWSLTEGQPLATDLGYAPLPPAIVTRALALLGTIRTS